MYMKAREWGPEQAEEARRCYEDLGIFKHADFFSSKLREYPIDEVTQRPDNRVQSEKRRKSDRKAQRLARRKNRRW
jgi:hypothetical protein